MLFVDSRVGSRELMRYFPPGIGEFSKLGYGDCMWLGNGPAGPVHIGVEVKRIGDMLKSILDGRFAGHQLPGLLNAYHVTYLILEGRFRPARDTGILQVPFRGAWIDASFGTKRWMSRDLDGFLTTMEVKFGLKVRRTYDHIETARTIMDLYHWWVDKEWEEHHSGLSFDTSGEPLLLPASVECRVAAQLKGLGWKRAHAAEKHFKALARERGMPPLVAMMLASKEDWMNVPGLGKKTATTVVEEIWRQTT